MLKKMFWFTKQQYNALLGKGLRKFKVMRTSPLFEEMKKLHRQKGEKKEAQIICRQLAESHTYRECNLLPFQGAPSFRNLVDSTNWIV